MSRYELQKEGSSLTVAVGWDRPLKTYFGIAYDPELPEEEEIRLWVGTNVGEISSVPELARALKDFAELPAEIVAKLEHEQALHEPTLNPKEHQKTLEPKNEGWLK